MNYLGIKQIFRVITAAVLIPLSASLNLAHAQSVEWKEQIQIAKDLHREGHFKKAEAALKRALREAESTSGPNHPDVAECLTTLADFYVSRRQYSLAEPLLQRALVMWETAMGQDHVYVAPSLDNLATFYSLQGQYAKAEELIKRALASREAALGPDHVAVALGLNQLSDVYLKQGKYTQVEQLLMRSLKIQETTFGPDHPQVAIVLNNLGGFYLIQAQYREAERLLKRSLEIREKKLNPDHPDILQSKGNLAGLYEMQGLYSQAEPLLKYFLEKSEEKYGPDDQRVGVALGRLGSFYVKRGKYTEAEPLLTRSIAIFERSLGLSHPDVAWALGNLSRLYSELGQGSQVAELQVRRLEILETRFGSGHPDVALALNDIALGIMGEGNYPLAESLFLRAISIDDNAFGPNNLQSATPLGNLGSLYARTKDFMRAELFRKRALAIEQNFLGLDHPRVAFTLQNFADLYADQGKHAEAEEGFKRSLSILEKVYGPDHPSLAIIYDNLAGLYIIENKSTEALDAIRRSTHIRSKALLNTSENSKSRLLTKADNNLDLFAWHAVLIAGVLPHATNRSPLIAEAFSVSQYAQMGSTGVALAKMAAQASSGTPALSQKVREHQEALSVWRRFDKELIEALSRPADQRSEGTDQFLRQRLIAAEATATRLNAELQRDFPQYREMVSPEPLAVTDAQKLLGPDEALVTYLVTEKQTLVWVIRPKTAELIRIEINAGILSKQVSTLRDSVDLIGGTQASSHVAAHELYKSIFSPVVPILTGVKHIMVVAGGPLQSVPFGMLLSKETPSAQEANIPWLIREFSFTNLPAVTSLRALRKYPAKQLATEPFVGFGDPVLKGAAGNARGVSIAKLFARGAIADINELNNLDRLPETADELMAISKTLKARKGSVYLGEAATERQVKSMNLLPYRVIAFSTHGLLSGEFKGQAEPSLVLTPPAIPSALDDGLLTASEVAGLKINADLVILSACNTAGTDGTPGADGFSGLSKAFLFAGSRTLLVSHWAVDSIATVALTTEFLAEVAKGAGPAEALRNSMLALIDHPTDSALRHPSMWAPFVVVGEGSNRSP